MQISQPKPATPPAPPGLSLQDILLVLFKHKGKIFVCAAIGVVAAAAVYFFTAPLYESQAKLLVRYVVDTSAIDPEIAGNSGKLGEAINSEVQIITSWDLVTQVAEAIGAKRLLPEANIAATQVEAAGSILKELTAIPAGKASNVIMVSYQNRDPQLARTVLDELIGRYFVKHLEVHRSAEAFNFVTQQSDQVRARLNQTEEQLKQLKGKARITSVPESTTNLNAELARTHEALKAAETEQAEQEAIIQEMDKPVPGQEKKSQDVSSTANSEVVRQYQAIIARLASLRQTDLELVSRYAQKTEQPQALDEHERTRQVRPQSPQYPTSTAQASRTPAREITFVGAERDQAQTLARERYRRQNDSGFNYLGDKKSFDALVKEAEQEIIKQKIDNSLDYKASADERARLSQLQKLNQLQIDNLERQRNEFEQKHPGLAATIPAASFENLQAEIAAERARLAAIEAERRRLAGIEARREVLKAHLDDVRKQTEQLSELAPQIEQLERTKQIEENNYKYFQASLEKARVDEALDPSKMPNISVVQKPSPAMRVTGRLKKVVLGLAGAGVACGLALAFLIELVLDRTVKRPGEVEKLLGAPILLSIPYLNGRNPLRLRWPARQKAIVLRGNGNANAAPWEPEHFVRPYSEAIRDRLVLYFELNHMNHKPKLVAVTGCSDGAGASTLAGGLAAALSDTGDGKVLLVDMNVGRPEIQPFFQGAPACSLTEALIGEPAQAGENLYLATATPPDERQAPLIPRKFYDLMPHLKASDFDYIIFDMPPFSQTSITLPMSRFMDKVVLVAEAGKSSRNIVKRAKMELSSVGSSVAVILNKARSYAPKWVEAEG